MDLNTTQMKGNVVLHVRQDSDSDLEQLFSSVLSPKDGPKSLPLRYRKLPPSFFKPPAGSVAAGNMQFGSPGSPMMSKESPVMGHSRAHSSPASLGQMAVVQQQQQQQQMQQNNFMTPHHTRAQSHDALESEPPLPPGWEARVTPQGQKYYIDHRERVTTWTHPRMKPSMPVIGGNQSQQLPPLPDGIEQAVTPEGETYFINHLTKTTSWYDPRLGRPSQGAQQGGPQQMNQQNLRFMQQAEKEKMRQQQMFLQQQSQNQADPLLNRSSMLNNLMREKYGNAGMTSGVGIHGRVESVDSGLDGMGSFLSPTSSDVDVMNGLEDVDMEGDQPVGGNRFNTKEHNGGQDLRTLAPNRLPAFFDSMQGTNVDLGILEGETDLGTGLEGINSELLSDVDIMLSPSSKTEPALTWL